jgi:hypothetical protein
MNLAFEILYYTLGTITAAAYGCMTYTILSGRVPFQREIKRPERPKFKDSRPA